MQALYRIIFPVLNGLILFFISNNLSAQKEFNVNIIPVWENETLVFNDGVSEIKEEEIKIAVIKGYFSQFKLLKNNKVVWEETNSYNLLDVHSKFNVKLIIPNDLAFDEISFDIGVDSAKSVSGAYGGDLDPMNGMYWTWNSGYINFKIEGTSPKCNTRKNAFKMHIGGYQKPYETIRKCSFKVDSMTKMNLKIDLKTIFEQVELEKNPSVMIPGKEASNLATIIQTSISKND